MGLSKSRTITVVVALTTLSSNVLSSLLFHQLPDDPYHLATNFNIYLHFANIASVFGFIGAVRQHALSVTLFAHYLILDTILCSMPRLLVLSMLNSLTYSFICEGPISPSSMSPSTSPSDSSNPNLHTTLHSLTTTWSPDSCARILYLSQLTLAAGVVAATLLQFVGALWVRGYGQMLWVRDCWAEAREVMGEERRELAERDWGLDVIPEEGEECEVFVEKV